MTNELKTLLSGRSGGAEDSCEVYLSSLLVENRLLASEIVEAVRLNRNISHQFFERVYRHQCVYSGVKPEPILKVDSAFSHRAMGMELVAQAAGDGYDWRFVCFCDSRLDATVSQKLVAAQLRGMGVVFNCSVVDEVRQPYGGTQFDESCFAAYINLFDQSQENIAKIAGWFGQVYDPTLKPPTESPKISANDYARLVALLPNEFLSYGVAMHMGDKIKEHAEVFNSTFEPVEIRLPGANVKVALVRYGSDCNRDDFHIYLDEVGGSIGADTMAYPSQWVDNEEFHVWASIPTSVTFTEAA